MPHDKPLTLSVARAGDLLLPAVLFFMLVFLSALLSPQPVYASMTLAVLLIATGGAVILDFFKVNRSKLISIIFADGSVRLESADVDTIGGYLDGQQWCCQWFAVAHRKGPG